MVAWQRRMVGRVRVRVMGRARRRVRVMVRVRRRVRVGFLIRAG